MPRLDLNQHQRVEPGVGSRTAGECRQLRSLPVIFNKPDGLKSDRLGYLVYGAEKTRNHFKSCLVGFDMSIYEEADVKPFSNDVQKIAKNRACVQAGVPLKRTMLVVQKLHGTRRAEIGNSAHLFSKSFIRLV